MWIQDAFYKEKSGNNQLEQGDICSHFFHISARINASRCNTTTIFINDVVVEQEDLIAEHVVRYYENLYEEGSLMDNILIDSIVEPMVIDNQNTSIIAYLQRRKYVRLYNSMSQVGVPGPDGFGGCFFKACWKIIKFDLIALVQYFFIAGSCQRTLIMFICA